MRLQPGSRMFTRFNLSYIVVGVTLLLAAPTATPFLLSITTATATTTRRQLLSPCDASYVRTTTTHCTNYYCKYCNYYNVYSSSHQQQLVRNRSRKRERNRSRLKSAFHVVAGEHGWASSSSSSSSSRAISSPGDEDNDNYKNDDLRFLKEGEEEGLQEEEEEEEVNDQNRLRLEEKGAPLNETEADEEADGGDHEDGESSSSSSSSSSNNNITLSIGDDIKTASLSLSKNVSYFYLRDEIGLSDAAMWKITYEAGSALGMTTATIRDKIEVLREAMNLTNDDLHVILERHPSILHLSAHKNIAPTLLFLIRALDLGRNDLKCLVLACPSVLSYSRANLKSKINFFSDGVMGYTIDECRNLFLLEPKLLRAGVRTGFVPRTRFLTKDMEIPFDTLRIIVKKYPRILISSLQHNLVPKLMYYFVMTLNMTPVQIQKLLLSYPEVLDYNLDRHILPITEYFVKELDISQQEFAKIVLKFPKLLTHSLRKIKHVVGYLRYELGFVATEVKRILYQAPQIISLNTDNTLRQKVHYIQTSFQMTSVQLRSLISGMPTLLILSTSNNLQPKIQFLRQSFKQQHKDDDDADDDTTTMTMVRESVLRSPSLLGYSLEKRIRPRMNDILNAKIPPTTISVGITFKDVDYKKWLQRKIEQQQKEEDGESNGMVMTTAFVPASAATGVASSSSSSDGTGSTSSSGQAPPSKPTATAPRIMHWTRERHPSS